MNQTLKNRFRKALLAWYAASRRDLPWRHTDDPYRIWLSEAMLQQTQVARVVEYYHRFLNELPDVRALADANEEKVLKLWEGLGYYSRARNLHRAAKRMVERYGGVVPSTYDELLELPGFGTYTAAAVSSIAFGEQRAVIDGNVTRVVARLRASDIGDDLPRQSAVVAEFVAAMIPVDRPGDFNQAMMELGATVCRPKNPNCGMCPVSAFCDAFGTGRTSGYPLKKVRPLRPTIEEAAILLENGNHLLLHRRTGEKLLGGLWEFPASPLEPGETPETAAMRLLADRFGIDRPTIVPVADLTHVFTHFIQKLRLFSCRAQASHLPPECRWADEADIARLPLTRMARKILAVRAKELR